MARNDIHTVSNIRPEEYAYCFSYALATQLDGWPVPPINVDMVVELRASGAKFAQHGGLGNCTVCGAAFKYGDVWRHMPTGEYIHIGHICAPKYSLIADRRDFEAQLDGARVRSAREHEKAMKVERFEAFVDANDLVDVMETDHYIVQDIKQKLYQYGSISDKQISLCRKLYNEANRPKPENEEVLIPVPIKGKRQEIEGEIVSVKVHDSMYGSQLKMTVKVTTNEGVYLVWGTCPQSLCDALEDGRSRMAETVSLRGALVKFEAALKQGRDVHFAIFSRPTKAIVVKWAEKE